jgi:two-component system sensor histidine kinase UhpB
VLALVFAVRQIAQPLQALERKSAEVGRGDLQALQEPVGGVEEIKSLQRTLVQMAQRLRAYEQSVRRYAGTITRSQEDERLRVARELHDETIQALIALDQRIQLAQKAAARDPEDRAGHLIELRHMTQELLGGLRRIIGALRPIYLEDLGLPSALQMLAEDAAAAGRLEVSFAATGTPRRLANEFEIAIYRIAQEALSNVTRHAQAGHANVKLGFEASRLVLTIEDNGVGFAVPDPDLEPATGSHYGLLGMRERAELIHGRLTVRSAPGSGTSVLLEIPD